MSKDKPKKTPATRTREITLDDGRTGWEYSDGAIRDDRGRAIVPLPGKHTISKEDASILVTRRWNNYRRAAVKRITGEAASIDPTVSTGADAFGVVAARQYVALMESEKPRIKDLEALQRIMAGDNPVAPTSPRSENFLSPSALSASPDALLELARRIEQEIAQRVDRARAVDATAAQADSRGQIEAGTDG